MVELRSQNVKSAHGILGYDLLTENQLLNKTTIYFVYISCF